MRPPGYTAAAVSGGVLVQCEVLMNRVKNKVAILTGGTLEIGRAVLQVTFAF